MRGIEAVLADRDTFPKIIVRNDIGKSWYDEQGILNVGLTDFLPDRSIVD